MGLIVVRSDEFDRWAHAIEAAVLESGVDTLGCDILVHYFEPDNYSWGFYCRCCGELDDPHRFPREAQKAVYDTFHRACLLAEPLRPTWVVPSPVLQNLIDNQTGD